MKRKPAFGLLFILLSVWQLASVIPVSACTAIPAEMPSLEERVDAADRVLVGTVAGNDGSPYGSYTIQVESYLKHEGPDTVFITGFGAGVGDCRSVIRVGDRLIFFLTGNPETDDILHASYNGASGPLLGATDENIAAVSAITGQEPTPGYDVPLRTRIQSMTYSPNLEIAVLATVPLIVIAGGLAVIKLTNRRKSKKKNQAS